MNFIRFNYGIYESDFVYLGGRVEYTGKIIEKSWRSVVEEAEIFFEEYHCTVWMERFRKGDAVIVAFVCDGQVISEEECKFFPQTVALRLAYGDATEKSYVCIELNFFRKVKQGITVLFQIVCIITFILGIVTFNDLSRIGQIGVLIGLPLIFLFSTCLYSAYRNIDPETYKPLFSERSGVDVR